MYRAGAHTGHGQIESEASEYAYSRPVFVAEAVIVMAPSLGCPAATAA